MSVRDANAGDVQRQRRPDHGLAERGHSLLDVRRRILERTDDRSAGHLHRPSGSGPHPPRRRDWHCLGGRPNLRAHRGHAFAVGCDRQTNCRNLSTDGSGLDSSVRGPKRTNVEWKLWVKGRPTDRLTGVSGVTSTPDVKDESAYSGFGPGAELPTT